MLSKDKVAIEQAVDGDSLDASGRMLRGNARFLQDDEADLVNVFTAEERKLVITDIL